MKQDKPTSLYKHITEKYIFQIILFIVLVVISESCYTTLRTGKYIIDDVRGFTVNFKGVPGDWHVPTDTLKIGDTIFLKRVFREKDANVW